MLFHDQPFDAHNYYMHVHKLHWSSYICIKIMFYIYLCKLAHSCATVMKSKLSDSRVRDHVVHLGQNIRVKCKQLRP